MNGFDIPVAIFMFKRPEKTAMIIDQIAKLKPLKLYLIADGPRNAKEKEAVEACRRKVEQHIVWDCEVIKNYAPVNRGVYQNIAGGAKWVFSLEERAIFLEDDNFPALSFFQYCKELLERYKDDTRILWICGTNYMGKSELEDGSDYCFTKLMLPCGWASWSDKFLKYYEGEMNLYRDKVYKEKVKITYNNKLLYKHDYPQWDLILANLDKGMQPRSWDYQMAFSLRVHNMFGIAPKYNQITNIGADELSIHGGVSMNNVMTQRFCEVPIYDLTFPLKHPKTVMVDGVFEKKTEGKIILPLQARMKSSIVKYAKLLLGTKVYSKILSSFKHPN